MARPAGRRSLRPFLSSPPALKMAPPSSRSIPSHSHLELPCSPTVSPSSRAAQDQAIARHPRTASPPFRSDTTGKRAPAAARRTTSNRLRPRRPCASRLHRRHPLAPCDVVLRSGQASSSPAPSQRRLILGSIGWLYNFGGSTQTRYHRLLRLFFYL